MVTRFGVNGVLRGFVRNPLKSRDFPCPKLFLKSSRSFTWKNFRQEKAQQQRSFSQREYKFSIMDEAPVKRGYEVNIRINHISHISFIKQFSKAVFMSQKNSMHPSQATTSKNFC